MCCVVYYSRSFAFWWRHRVRRGISGRLAEPTETTLTGSNANVKRGWPGEASARRPAATPRAAVAAAAVAEGAVAEGAATDSERCRPATTLQVAGRIYLSSCGLRPGN